MCHTRYIHKISIGKHECNILFGLNDVIFNSALDKNQAHTNCALDRLISVARPCPLKSNTNREFGHSFKINMCAHFRLAKLSSHAL